MSKHVEGGGWSSKNCLFPAFYVPKGALLLQKLSELTTLELDLQYSITKSYEKCQLNMSKHVREKCGILCISSILSSKRDITPTTIHVN